MTGHFPQRTSLTASEPAIRCRIPADRPTITASARVSRAAAVSSVNGSAGRAERRPAAASVRKRPPGGDHSSAGRLSMKELTEKTALPAPAGP
ncbi:hypothetical protein Asi03nite_09750 [Actinoplanes siamensis]|uniref:Uncharacterized protein n=1 Tax=Actinoplanes siamensis TaxID=1223317 RepID=A0A919KDY4_9ACTN|nr:hypothetical protein Asi03nite_09750 [Actinoplanes siamensis]